MSESRYSELKFEGQTYTEQWKIDEILIKNKFNWMVNAEIKNARLEIFENTLVWNAGIWYNGSWYFGVWRDGEWRYGIWQNGVWYNGVWRDGTFKSGIIYKGKFFKGKIESGEIRGGQFIGMEIDPKVVEYTGDEYQVKKEEEQKAVQQATATAQPAPTTDQPVKVHSTLPAGQQPVSAQPKIQQEKKEYKKLKTFENWGNSNEIEFENESEYNEPIYQVGDKVEIFYIYENEIFEIESIEFEEGLEPVYICKLVSHNSDELDAEDNYYEAPENEIIRKIEIQQEKLNYKNMKKIKTFEAFFNAFENFQENDIYTLIDFLDKKHSELDSGSDEFGGSYLNYNIIDNDTLEVTLGWDSPEEFMRLESIIKFEDDKITLKGSQEGSSVYSEDGKNYENDYNESFDNVNQIIDFLDKEI